MKLDKQIVERLEQAKYLFDDGFYQPAAVVACVARNLPVLVELPRVATDLRDLAPAHTHPRDTVPTHSPDKVDDEGLQTTRPRPRNPANPLGFAQVRLSPIPALCMRRSILALAKRMHGIGTPPATIDRRLGFGESTRHAPRSSRQDAMPNEFMTLVACLQMLKRSGAQKKRSWIFGIDSVASQAVIERESSLAVDGSVAD